MSIASIKKQSIDRGKLTEIYDKHILDRATKETSHWDGKFHASAIGGCPTAAAMQILGFGQGEVIDNAKGLRIFRHGHAVHDMLQSEFIGAGVITENADGSPRIEVSIVLPMPDGGEIIGHADGEIKAEVYGSLAVLEVKSINSNALSKLKEPKPEHKIQAGIYKRALDVDVVVFIYYGKDTSEIKEFKYKPTPSDDKQIDIRYGKIVKLVEAWHNNQEFPEPEYTATSKPPCSYCKWVNVCHSTFDREKFIEKCKESSFATKKKTEKKAIPRKGPPRKLTRFRKRS